MAVEHVDITDPELHEPKGASTATANLLYSADGLGSGTWQKIKNVNLHGVSATPVVGCVPVSDGSGGFVFELAPHSSLYYSAIGTGTTYTTPTTYTLINPTTTVDDSPIGFTTNSAGRLTYTGARTCDATFMVSLTIKHSTGSNNDCYFQIYKNGAGITQAETVQAANSTNYGNITLIAHAEITTNDYFEVYCKTAAGSIIVHAMTMLIQGH